MPVLVALPPDLTRAEPEPVLPADASENEDVAEYVAQLKAWGRGLAGKLREIAGLQPKAGE